MKQRKTKEDIQSTPDKLNLQGKSNKVRVIGNIGSLKQITGSKEISKWKVKGH